MKNEYFGDIKDYRKFGLLRSLLTAENVKLLVAWMLTGPDPKRPNDGQSLGYLDREDKYGDCDPALYGWLRRKIKEDKTRNVSLVENSEILKDAAFYSAEVPGNRQGRQEWAKGLYQEAKSANIVFLDPDIGIEIASNPCEKGNKGANKYVSWTEIKHLWNDGKSLLIYQHFARTKHEEFIRSKVRDLKRHLCAPQPYQLTAFRTPHVLFLLALQERLDFGLGEAWKRNGQLWQWSDSEQ